MGNQINSAGPSHSHTGLMGHGSDSEPLWKFLDFIAMHRSPLYTLLLPFIHTRARMPADNEQERTFQLCAKVSKPNVKTRLHDGFIFLGYPMKLVKSFSLIFQERIGLGSVVQGGKSKSLLLSELGQELGTQRDRLNKRMQGNLFHIDFVFPTFQKP